MSWIIFSILAAFIWATANMLDKYILTKWVKRPIIPLMFVGIVGFIASLLIYFIRGYSSLSRGLIFIALIAGAIYILDLLFYFRAMKIEEASRVVPLFHLSPLFVTILATIFLGEILTIQNYFGILAIVTGAVLISLKKEERIVFSKAAGYMLLASLLSAVSFIIIKYLLGFTDYWTVFSYLRIGAFLAVIPILILNFKHIVFLKKKFGYKPLIFMSFTETLNLGAILSIIFAASIGLASLVNALSSIQPFFVLIFAMTISLFFPGIFKEQITKSTIFIKIISITLMFVGILLIT